MYLPRRLREAAAFDLGDDGDETFRDLLLDALAQNAEVQTAIRRLAAPAKIPEPRAARRR